MTHPNTKFHRMASSVTLSLRATVTPQAVGFVVVVWSLRRLVALEIQQETTPPPGTTKGTELPPCPSVSRHGWVSLSSRTLAPTMTRREETRERTKGAVGH